MAYIFLFIFILLFIYQKWSAKNIHKYIKYSFTLSHILKAPDEKFDLITEVVNTGYHFVPHVKLIEFLPASIEIHDNKENISVGYYDSQYRIVSDIFLFPRGVYRNKINASIPKRGFYTFNKMYMTGGDFLSLAMPYRLEKFFNKEIIIYPPLKAFNRIQNLMAGFLGEKSVRRFLYEDPNITVGFNDYTGREPMKSISWLQSAKTGKIVVKSFDYTYDASVVVLLNVEHGGFNGDDYTDIIENCFSLTHSVCRWLEDKKIKYSFCMNAKPIGTLINPWQYLHDGLGGSHYTKILEGLGRASYEPAESFSSLLKRSKKNHYDSPYRIIITPGNEKDTVRLLKKHEADKAIVISGTW
jgi:hypothetical protein